MTDKDLYKAIEILMEVSKERYFEFKKEVLVNTEISDELIRFFNLLFDLIEKRRPELQEGGAF